MKDLISHFEPKLLLKDHLAQVRAAGEIILNEYPNMASDPRVQGLFRSKSLSHDLGKGISAFQEYIRNPRAYTGSRFAKSHASISAALAILWARELAFDPLDALCVAQAVAGHHAGFRTLEDLENALTPDDNGVIEAQWQSLNRRQLAGLLPELSAISTLDLISFESAGRWLFRSMRIENRLAAMDCSDALSFRLLTQFLFSILLEADRAFLALGQKNVRRWLGRKRIELNPSLVDIYIGSTPDTPINQLRRDARSRVMSRTSDDIRSCTITLPTGVGKTLIAATWALTIRGKLAEGNYGKPPKVIIVLPYLSIIDQTEQVWRSLLGLQDKGSGQSEVLAASHSISDRSFEVQEDYLTDHQAEFLLDTWRSEVIITTFDQLLLACFSHKTRHMMRFHHLMNALIVLDEVQTLPCKLWDPVDQALRALTVTGQSRVLMMSATQPAMLSHAGELAGDVGEVTAIFNQFARYRIRLEHRRPVDIDTFLEGLEARIRTWIDEGARVLITLNTRASARRVYERVRMVTESMNSATPAHLISADVTPLDRMDKITQIKGGGPCLVVSTQTVEAGVDIDMDLVIRDFAPFDSIIQVAGRCNRNNIKGDHGGIVELISLTSPSGKKYAALVYDSVLLDATYEVLNHNSEIREEDVLSLSTAYFDLLKERKNLGTEFIETFIRWQEVEDIRALLRGKQRTQVSFVVQTDAEAKVLIARLELALSSKDRWERKSAVRSLAGSLQKRTVSVLASTEWDPREVADPVGPFYILREGYYSADSGISFRREEGERLCVF